ncbi:hypothetical protein VZ95_13045 [Elstera litoralis]|uniref:Uncharacterized protein n=1 Tax=Elstera litoralis TaxID=552518 RepID=A0A0F3IR54_9PROT|nr:hypothetical protein [Elstera litoralis]KJV09191.1 hypothetical protein VZ95_13045 [Elstera litoralis]
MPTTKPVTPQEFWPLFEAWAKARITPGVLALPHGWSDWALSDFQAYALTQAGLDQSPDAGGLDITRSAHLLLGGDRLAYLFNRENPQATRFILCLSGQSLHQSAADYSAGIQRDMHRLSEGRVDPTLAGAVPILVGVCWEAEARSALRGAGFETHFSVPLEPSGGTVITALSLRVAPATGGTSPRWPERVVRPPTPALASLIATAAPTPPVTFDLAALAQTSAPVAPPIPPVAGPSPFTGLFRPSVPPAPSPFAPPSASIGGSGS